METRKEIDPLGERLIPKDAYYGIQTLRATENFIVSGIKAPLPFIRAYVLIKKSAAIANAQVGWLEEKTAKAIIQACDEVLAGKLLNQFMVDVFQAGAGTSFNMNVNEILANRALEILGKAKGNYKTVNPNDHVNMGQSTNDTFPTALHVSVLMALQPLLSALDELADAFNKLGKKYANTLKSGRTHLQDAVPVTIGQEFNAYGSAIANACAELRKRQENLYSVALGGTATGTGANTHPEYKRIAIAELAKMTGFPLSLQQTILKRSKVTEQRKRFQAVLKS